MSSRGYGQVMGEQYTDASKAKKRVAVIAVSAVVLVAMVVAVAVSIGHHGNAPAPPANSDGQISQTVKAIQSICQPTDYKQTCVETLTQAAGSNVTDPAELVKLTFSVAVDHLRGVFNQSSLLKSAAKDPRTKHALDNCEELLDYAIDDLRSSVAQLGSIDLANLNRAVEDIKIWLSAAITYEETCLDGFENTTGDAGDGMRRAMNASMALTQNTLAIVNDVSSVLASFKLPFFSRKLLLSAEEEGLPGWVDGGMRRLLEAAEPEIVADIVVAKDGTGDVSSVNDALAQVKKKSDNATVIYVKAGVYKETVQVGRSLTNVVLIGDGAKRTRITGNLNFVDGTPTFKTATFAVVGDGFMAKNIGFENSAGAAKHQAVALRVGSDRAIFYNCSMDGYQDTLYAHTKRQFYRDCTISGTIDFVFGNAAVVFQNCVFKVRKPLDNQQNIVTAQGRKDKREPTAIVLHNCTITADPAYFPARMKLKSYLGRPWKEYSRTLIFQSQIDDLIDPQGWLPWLGDFGLSTCFYSEFDNRGAGSGMTQRATWRGVKKMNYGHALKFTVENFIQGNSWVKPSGVPFIPGLLPVAYA
ncbi:putative pectinesterase/pectinesterase inhibitor 21 [Wolffia australiana]